MALRIAYSQPQVGATGFARTRKDLGGAISLLAADLVTGGQVAAFKVPAGFMVTSIIVRFRTALDTNGAPTLTISVGDAASTTRFLNASTTGRAGGLVNAIATTDVPYLYSVDTDILITATAGSATAVAGIADVYLGGFIVNP